MMRKVALVLVLSLVSAGGALAANPSIFAGGQSGTHNVVGSGREVIWSEPVDLEGLIASSEVIGIYALETEIANDFWFTSDQTVGLARWWGGYWNNYGCSDVGYGAYWNLRFYNDGGCMPNAVIAEYLGQSADETSVYCQGGVYPIFRYEVWVNVSCSMNTLYWFGAQCADHTFPPQVGRVASAAVVGCDTVFKSAYFAYPDWTPGIDVFGVSFDASQEFEGLGIPPPDDWGACCIGDQGECQIVGSPAGCETLGGVWQGWYVECNPNPCDVSPVKVSTWGLIKNSYR